MIWWRRWLWLVLLLHGLFCMVAAPVLQSAHLLAPGVAPILAGVGLLCLVASAEMK